MASNTASAPQTAPPSAPAWHTLPLAPPPGTLLGAASDFQSTGAWVMDVPQPDGKPGVRPFGVLLLASHGELRAFANRCPHFGVPLAARTQQLIHQPGVSVSCNVHYARFRWADGVCDRGECEGESLISIALEVDAQGLVRMVEGPAAPAAST